MAPEQAQGGAIDARTDVYSLGVILYELLVGVVPFQGDTPLAVLHQHTAREPDPPSVAAPRRRISPDLDALVLRCLAKRPEDRFASMRDPAVIRANIAYADNVAERTDQPYG